jgi:hypothetical protein
MAHLPQAQNAPLSANIFQQQIPEGMGLSDVGLNPRFDLLAVKGGLKHVRLRQSQGNHNV